MLNFGLRYSSPLITKSIWNLHIHCTWKDLCLISNRVQRFQEELPIDPKPPANTYKSWKKEKYPLYPMQCWSASYIVNNLGSVVMTQLGGVNFQLIPFLKVFPLLTFWLLGHRHITYIVYPLWSSLWSSNLWGSLIQKIYGTGSNKKDFLCHSAWSSQHQSWWSRLYERLDEADCVFNGIHIL